MGNANVTTEPPVMQDHATQLLFDTKIKTEGKKAESKRMEATAIIKKKEGGREEGKKGGRVDGWEKA